MFQVVADGRVDEQGGSLRLCPNLETEAERAHAVQQRVACQCKGSLGQNGYRGVDTDWLTTGEEDEVLEESVYGPT